jgi:ABC-type sugar transport system substrate-binding protein
MKSTTIDKALRIFQQHSGRLRTSEAIQLGIAPRILYALRDSGQIEEVTRGVFQLPGTPLDEQTDLVQVALRIPKGVICLISALAFHNLTTHTEAVASFRVAIVPPGFTSPFHVALKDGAVNVGKQIGWKVDVVAAENENDFAGQVAVVEQELQKGIFAISINPIDARAIVTAVREANKAHIPVFMHNLITPVSDGKVEEYIGYDQWNGAAKLAHYTCDLLHNQGYVYILVGIPGFHTNRRTQGYQWGLQQNCPGVTVVGE